MQAIQGSSTNLFLSDLGARPAPGRTKAAAPAPEAPPTDRTPVRAPASDGPGDNPGPYPLDGRDKYTALAPEPPQPGRTPIRAQAPDGPGGNPGPHPVDGHDVVSALAPDKPKDGPVEDPFDFSPDARAMIQRLQAVDSQVRSHEHAHAAVGGAYAGAPSFQFQAGPDGRQYAVGGEVPISLRSGGSPQETMKIARQVRAAALAPPDPSAQDLRVAANAAALESQAAADAAREEREDTDAKTASTVAAERGGSLGAAARGYGWRAVGVPLDTGIMSLFG